MGPEDNEDVVYYGSTSDSTDVRYADDCHETYGMQYGSDED